MKVYLNEGQIVGIELSDTGDGQYKVAKENFADGDFYSCNDISSQSISFKDPTSTNRFDINAINEAHLQRMDGDKPLFLYLLSHSEFEDGMNNEAIEFLASRFKENEMATFKWLNKEYASLSSDPILLSGLLRCIAMSDCASNDPSFTTMAISGLAHKSIDVNEAAIGLIEAIRSAECLNALKEHAFEMPLLEDYRKIVADELEKELAEC